ncbi:MAG: PQQ-binding-like beta-propeller repeat protein [Lentisphaerae bacterium]|jgi:outer membrane protein assembly factor BamB|nr:PQQ-binding-like beta-propeller repeat protein [Lentisphaerota bacterium]MBT4818315.1 PQQ-binding-like beta-propeller repeat protein [Lentisphaerota bacterium]MBT5604344.1 PQQ-binding-like beta-propeller repeat protein [Lentisphaerota bacterium]MBT7054183.1 PQQ-binding-like beta-propeller repeat protein [Lentisphaerota bacterium]MBT7843560.1 PQQ-binding-like beta-propeller repeat protein [Lentisphaerota bacterium]
MGKQTWPSPLSSRRLPGIVTVASCLLLGVTVSAQTLGSRLVSASGVRGGLIVHLGCGDGRLTVGLRGGETFVVHGLDTDASKVAAGRRHAADVEASGSVSFARFDGKALPLVDGLVGVIVLSEPCRVPAAEFARALAPRGVLLTRVPVDGLPNNTLLASIPSSIEGWAAYRKPVPAEIDEWTHFLHGPDGHVMSRDHVVGPPHHIQWIGSPKHSRSHIRLTTVNVMVTGGGRLFYIADISPTGLPEDLPGRWAVIARNAFNGIELWRRPLSAWQTYYVKDRNSYPADVHRRLVAAADRVFVTLDIHGSVSALDAATGKTVRTYEGTEKAEDIVHEDGILYLSMNTGTREQLDRRKMAYRHVEPTQKRLMAVDAASGRTLWRKQDQDTDGVMPMTLAAKADRLYFQNPREVVCLTKATGTVVWRSSRPSEYLRPGWSSPTLTVLDDVVISADRQSGPNQKVGKDKYAAGGFSTGNLVTFSAETGERLWSAPCAEGCRAPTDVFSVDGKVWFGKTLERRVHEYREAHDVKTGVVLHETPVDETWPKQHHHRCYRDKATVNYILGGRTGVEFIELATGEVSLHTWLRGNCKFGVMPANGLLYMPPEQCGCYIESKLTGFHALAPRRIAAQIEKDTHPLERGPAFGEVSADDAPPEKTAGDWPTFRGDAARTGRAAKPVSPAPAEAWRVSLGGELTPPVVANGVLLVARKDTHVLHAANPRTGEALWDFVAGGRIDSPPTVARGLVVFGCCDGWVYALRCRDGALVWRFRAAPAERMLVVNERVESVWPVHGSVLVQDEVITYAAGRSSYVDGGMRMGQLDLTTGKQLLSKTFYSRDPETGDAVPLYEPFPSSKRYARMEMPGVLPDVLSSDGRNTWMRAVTFDQDLEIKPEFPSHLFSSMGFLDDSWWELSYWMYGKHMFGGRAGVGLATTMYPHARIMVCDEDSVYGYQYGYERVRSPSFIASGKIPRIKTVKLKKGTRKRIAYTWRATVPLHVNGLVLAGDTLFMAGPPEVDIKAAREVLNTVTTDNYDPPAPLREALDRFRGRQGGFLVSLNKDDGKKQLETKVDVIPVFDGLIAANGSLFLSSQDGLVVCFR